MGRFTSIDPYNIIFEKEDAKDEKEGRKLFTQYISQTQNWNRYVYVWNNPLKNIDPTGEDVYVVTYTTNNTEGDAEFKRAAETKADHIRNMKGYDPNKDTVVIKGVKTKEDFANVVKEANALEKQYGKVEQITLYSHAGPRDGPMFEYGQESKAQFTQKDIRNLSVNWSTTAIAKFYGCNTANFALLSIACSKTNSAYSSSLSYSGRK